MALTAAAQKKVDALRSKDATKPLIQQRLINLHPRRHKPSPALETGLSPALDAIREKDAATAQDFAFQQAMLAAGAPA